MTPDAEIRLTELSPGGGCACKLGPSDLAAVLEQLTPPAHADLLVGSATGDDAAVWRLDDERALVITTDFFTPIVDDARTWGRIAAVNAVSDVYAMGGRPLVALNLVAWPRDALSAELLVEVLAGGQEAAAAGGFVIAGGHSIDDPVPKFGLAVVGEVHPDRVLTNAGLRVGDALVLTKPLGVGVITSGIKRAVAPAEFVDAAIASMTRLNDRAARAALDAGARGATDVTGFGLLGHLGRMAVESGVDVVIDVQQVPVLPGARALARAGCVPGGSERNLTHVRDRVDAAGVDEIEVVLLADAQTSGGLVFGAAPARAAAAVDTLRASGHDAAVIGEVTASGTGLMRLR